MGRLKTGTGRDGRSNAFARSDEPTLSTAHVSHGHGDHATGHAVPGNIAREGKEKAVHEIPYHSGMSPEQIAGAGTGGMPHPTAIIDASATALPVNAVINSRTAQQVIHRWTAWFTNRGISFTMIVSGGFRFTFDRRVNQCELFAVGSDGAVGAVDYAFVHGARW